MTSLRTYTPEEGFSGTIGRTEPESRPAWPTSPSTPSGAPNVITIVLDDMGFAQLGCYGGLGGRISTPNIDRLAANGLRFQDFHVTPLCSPTRAALLTGRNAHSVGVGTIMEYATGYPGYNSIIPADAAMTPAILQEAGYTTMALGKWHLTPDWENGPWGPFDRWPLAKGFDRFYGFMPGETSQWAPDLWQDNHRIDDSDRADGYHLSVDLVDRAIQWTGEQKVVDPERPFYLYLAFGAMHAPHHAPPEWIDRYRGLFDDGWDVIREQTLARQRELGVVPDNAEVPPHNPDVTPWAELPERNRRVLCRQMEVFAGFLSHTDHQIGRLLDHLADSGELDNTVILFLSDNGASAEGGEHGLFHEVSYFNRRPETFDEMSDRLDEWGTPTSHPHYASGWAEAGNTPTRWYKTTCHEGGTRVPLIVHWPAGVADPGAVRTEYAHVIDLAPTILDLIGLEPPRTVRRTTQRPFDGSSLRSVLAEPGARSPRTVQHFECFGHRAIWKDGWKAVAIHPSTMHAHRVRMPLDQARDGDYAGDVWELYELDTDFSEVHDRSAERPELLAELIELWWAEAGRYQVLPLDDRGGALRTKDPRPAPRRNSEEYRYTAPIMLGPSSSPDLLDRSFTVTADFDYAPGTEGVVVSYGTTSGGFTMYVLGGRLHIRFAYLGREQFHGVAEAELMTGPHRVVLRFERTGPAEGAVTVQDGDDVIAHLPAVRTNPLVWSIGQGLQIGGDSVSPVSADYRSPFRFTGVLRQVVVAVDPAAPAAPAVDTARIRQ